MTSLKHRTGALAVLAVAVIAFASLLASAPAPAEAQTGGGQIVGDVPASGGFALVAWTGGTTAQLQAAAAARGCTARGAWVTAEGQFVGYIYGAPDFVNAAFAARHAGLNILGGTALILVCEARRGNVPPEVNRIIDLIEARNLDGLEAAVRLTGVPCGPQQGAGSPPSCPPGQPDGTPVEVLPVSTCQGELRPRSSLRPTLAETLPSVRRLTGIYRAPAGYLPHAPQVNADFVAVFSREAPGQPNLGVGVVIHGGDVVGLRFGCGSTPAELSPPASEAVYVPGG